MNLLDENILADQRQMLLNWRVPFRQIGYDAARKGIPDDNIIPLLLTLRQPTFFTSDGDFFKRNLRHPRYCLVFLDVDESEAAVYVRRLLRHPQFNTQAKRMGAVVRVSYTGIAAWRSFAEQETHYDW